MIFSFEVHLLADKLVPVVTIHSLGGSRANRHHTPKPQPGATQPTQDDDHTSHVQSTRVAFCDLPRGKHKNPSQAQRPEPTTITNSLSTIHQSWARLGVSKHQE
jgi:hypothetical protein